MCDKSSSSNVDSLNDDDSVDIDTVESEPDDITSVVTSIGLGTFKTAIFLLLIFIILHSDVFIDRILTSSDNLYVEGREVTTKGVLVQGVLLSIGYIIINILVSCQCL
jgi:hypothetical protein